MALLLAVPSAWSLLAEIGTDPLSQSHEALKVNEAGTKDRAPGKDFPLRRDLGRKTGKSQLLLLQKPRSNRMQHQPSLPFLCNRAEIGTTPCPAAAFAV
jgi:hypothetical protein